VLQALTLNSLVPSTIDATVTDGWVTLTGTASSQFQRAEAEHATIRVGGVCGITNDVQLVPFGPSAGDVAAAITKAMHRNARLDASNVSVQSSSGTVTLRGTVPSWADHDDALVAAWNAPGVVNVIDDMQVVN
jgi:osmotically-inducible protein OsmY